MKSNLLLSNKFKAAGWIVFTLGLLFGVLYLLKGEDVAFFDRKVFAVWSNPFFEKQVFFQIVESNVLDEIAAMFIVVGALLIMFSKEKREDEFISSLRLNALLWATLINYAVLLVSIVFVYGFSFFWVLVFNMFTILFIFIVRFHWLLHKSSKSE